MILIVTISVWVEFSLSKAHVVPQGLSVNAKALILSLGGGAIHFYSVDNSFRFHSATAMNQQQSIYVPPDGWDVGLHRMPYVSASGHAMFVFPGVRYVTYADGDMGRPTTKGPSMRHQRRTLTVSGGVLILLVAAPWFRYQASKRGKVKEVGSFFGMDVGGGGGQFL